MTQLLHVVFDRDENKNFHVVHVGLDEASVKTASFQELEVGKSRLYAAIDVDMLHELMQAGIGLVAYSSMLLNPAREASAD